MTQEHMTDDKRSGEVSEEQRNKLLSELDPPVLDERRLYTRLNISYAGGLGISTLAIIEAALLPLVDTAQSIGIFGLL